MYCSTAVFEIRLLFVHSENNSLTLSSEALVNIQVSCRSWRVYNTVTVRNCLRQGTYPTNLYGRGLKHRVLNTDDQ
jgi:hypothetical protein